MKPPPFKDLLDGVEITAIPIQDLQNGWVVQAGDTYFLRSSGIDSTNKANALLQVAQLRNQQNPPSTLAIIQLDSPATEWEFIAREHAIWAWLENEHPAIPFLIHLSLPTEHLYVVRSDEPLSEFYLKDVGKLSQIENADAWMRYTFLLGMEAKRILKMFPIESLDTYTLEGLLEDFLHEVSTMQDDRRLLSEDILKEGSLQKWIPAAFYSSAELFPLEKRLFKTRSNIRERLRIQLRILEKVTEVIHIIEGTHPELQSLGNKTRLLCRIMGPQLQLPEYTKLSWAAEWMLLQLFHDEMGAMLAVNDTHGLDRVSFATALFIGLMGLKKHVSQKTLIDLALHWDDQQERHRKLAEQLRQNILRALQLFCIPMTMANSQPPSKETLERMREEESYLNLLPAYGEVLANEGGWIKAHLVKENPAARGTLSLTAAGHSMMLKLL